MGTKVSLDPPTKAEHFTFVFDYLKHLTTLSTGAIVLQVAFLEKAFQHPRWKAFITISLLSFAASIIGSTVAHTLTLGSWSEGWDRGTLGINTVAVLATWVGFLVGILAFTVFAIKNIWMLA
ncbi:MAG: hypothetical protein AABN95_07235 [Acidobacteriota bacterium]